MHGGSIARTASAIGIVASSGGSPALATLLGGPPARFPVPLPVRLAEDGLRLALDWRTLARPHRPSGDVLLSSLAESLGRLAAGVVLTGLGRDRALGLGRIARAGGFTVAQGEASSAVYGLPRAVAEAGAEVVLPLGQIAGRLLALRAAGEGA